jgi:hypothetical protein
MKNLITIIVVALLVSCNANSNKTSSEDSVVRKYENIPAERKIVNPNPVKTYEDTIKSFETTDEFKVAIYETKKTFHYLMKIEYKQMEVEDTLKVPNFGIQPAIEIVKGDSIQPSCIVGFKDEKNQFRESKLIYFDNDRLGVKVLKHYAVATYQDDAQ